MEKWCLPSYYIVLYLFIYLNFQWFRRPLFIAIAQISLREATCLKTTVVHLGSLLDKLAKVFKKHFYINAKRLPTNCDPYSLFTIGNLTQQTVAIYKFLEWLYTVKMMSCSNYISTFGEIWNFCFKFMGFWMLLGNVGLCVCRWKQICDFDWFVIVNHHNITYYQVTFGPIHGHCRTFLLHCCVCTVLWLFLL